MDFNLDDPLADLVSENSDSFYEATKKPAQTVLKHKEAKQQSTESQKILTSAKTMEDLFGIQSSTNLSKPQTEIKSTPPSSISIKKPVISKTEPSKSEDIFTDGDIIADLGFDPKKPKSSKSSILDDLLTSIDTSKNAQSALKYSRPLTAGGVNIPTKNISRQSTETDNSGPGTSQGTSLPTTRPKTSAGRRQSVNSGNDPLGLFTTPPAGSIKDQSFESKVDSNKEITSKKKITNINSDWLGLDLQSSIKKSDPKEINAEPQVFQVDHRQLPEAISSVPYSQQELSQISTNPNYSNPNAIAIVTANMETQNVIQTLNQQETQIMMATQLKNQERALLEMQKKQQELLSQQEIKFNELLKNQIIRQTNLEATIKTQQERINAHIQMLMTHPPLLSNTLQKIYPDDETKKSDSTVDIENQESNIQLEHDVKRLELEKLRLEDLISNINANHEKEIEFIENSHKKQILLLEDNLEIVQKRLQTEITSLQEFYMKKLNDLDLGKQKLVDEYEEKLKQLKENHEKNITDLKLDYTNSVQSLKSDHKSTIEAIRESKLMEFAIVQDNTSYLQILRNASTNLENVSGNLQTLRDEMYNKIDYEYKEKEDMLSQKEKRLNDLERRLKLSEESSEREKSRLIELVTTLEIQLQKLSNDSADEQWNLKQKFSALEVERDALEREKLYVREQRTRDERKLEELKQSQLEEYRKLMEKIEDEKNQLAVEKSKFETMKQLEENSDFNKSKTEIDIAIKVAKEATKQADVERQRFLKSQRDLEIRKRDLVDQENELRSKGEELESEILRTKSKEQKVREALQRQKYIEQSLNAKVQFLQNQTRVLSERETQLSQERLLISKERIDLQEFKRKVELNKCSLCKIGERSVAISNIITGNNILPDAENYGTEFNLVFSNNFTNNIDQLFDNDVAESLTKMGQLNKNCNIELGNGDDNVLNHDLNGQNFDLLQPQGLLDPDFSVIELNSRLSKANE